jgi:hypothetical protein
MNGLSPESWPILAAFLVLQGAITWPLVKYIRGVHEAQIADLKATIAALTAERDRFISYSLEANQAARAASNATQSVVAAAERAVGRAT